MEPIITDGIHIGEIPSQRTSDILEACNAIGEKFLQNNENKNGCIVSHRPTIADFAILPILRSMKITEHVGWKLSQIVDAYTERCMRIIPNMRECFIPLEAHINHMSLLILVHLGGISLLTYLLTFGSLERTHGDGLILRVCFDVVFANVFNNSARSLSAFLVL